MIIERIITSFCSGGVLTLDLLGGEAAILAEKEGLAQSPFLDVLTRLAAAQDASTALDAVVLRGLEISSDAISFREAISILVESALLASRIGARAGEILAARVTARRHESLPLIAAYALEGLIRLSLEVEAAPFQLLALLNGVRSDDEGVFAFHAARLVGVANDRWAFDHLGDTLERLLENEEAEPEAAFELGLLFLKKGLEADSLSLCLERLESANIYFRRAIETGECRDDAVSYAALITVIVGFAKDAPPETLASSVESLERAVFNRSVMSEASRLPAWARPRLDCELQWASLARLTRSVAENLTRPSWSKAYQVLNHVLAVYDADRTRRTGAGLATLVRPRIERAFVSERGLLAHLEDILDDETWTSEFRPAAVTLQEAVRSILLRGHAHSPAYDKLHFPNVPSELANDPAFRNLPQGLAWKLDNIFRNQAEVLESSNHPVFQDIIGSVLPGLQANNAFVAGSARDYGLLLVQIITFCSDRLDTSRKGLGGDRLHYLFKDDADERNFQDDLRQYLQGNLGWVSNIQFEVDSIGAGRIDIAVQFGMCRFIIELKKESSDASRENLKRFLAQSTAYQATNVRLGFLGVLDMSPRLGPAPTLAENVWLETYRPEGQNLHRSVIVFRVPGNLVAPSTFSKKKFAKPS
ncbi:hypothetical protein D3C87_1069970 [compost metagenome]